MPSASTSEALPGENPFAGRGSLSFGGMGAIRGRAVESIVNQLVIQKNEILATVFSDKLVFVFKDGTESPVEE